MTIVSNDLDSVINKRAHQFDQVQTTIDGISLQLVEPDIIKSVSRIGGTDNVEMTFEVSDANLVKKKFISRLLKVMDLLTIWFCFVICI